jgi:hypothetical protein
MHERTFAEIEIRNSAQRSHMKIEEPTENGNGQFSASGPHTKLSGKAFWNSRKAGALESRVESCCPKLDPNFDSRIARKFLLSRPRNFSKPPPN